MEGVVHVLLIGDIVGKPGRRAVRALLPGLVNKHRIDFVVANVENAAGGNGTTPAITEELYALGVECQTSGNHIWDQKEIIPYIDHSPYLLRPANFVPGSPGKGSGVFQSAFGQKIAVLNLIGRTFMGHYDCPFRTADREVRQLKEATPIVIVDMHGETTSEKKAIGWYLDGRVSAVVGTHTHVQTADEQILPGGTAFLTDLGMTGPHDSVIGIKKERSIERFVKQMARRYEVAEGDIRLEGAFIRIDEKTGKASSIERIRARLDEEAKENR